MSDVCNVERGELRPVEAVDLMVHAGLPSGTQPEWEVRLPQAQYIVTARNAATTALVGLGLLEGTNQRAEILLAVNRNQIEYGIETYILDSLVEYALAKEFQEVNINEVPDNPEQKAFFRRHGFKATRSAMRLNRNIGLEE